ncbi:hypothetical protein B0H11DRAFT_1922251 [Mycena galericulata]|nr:hypothetical protein B0H11DRAFT_1922251 [Mycena galericulata]
MPESQAECQMVRTSAEVPPEWNHKGSQLPQQSSAMRRHYTNSPVCQTRTARTLDQQYGEVKHIGKAEKNNIAYTPIKSPPTTREHPPAKKERERKGRSGLNVPFTCLMARHNDLNLGMMKSAERSHAQHLPRGATEVGDKQQAMSYFIFLSVDSTPALGRATNPSTGTAVNLRCRDDYRAVKNAAVFSNCEARDGMGGPIEDFQALNDGTALGCNLREIEYKT